MEEQTGGYISAETISRIVSNIQPELESWRSRRLEEVYSIVWLDAVHYKVRNNEGIVETRAVYNVLGLTKQGEKDLLGMYVSHSEGAKFWLEVLTDISARGVKDIMIACVDGEKGFPEAINSVFPSTRVQLCVVFVLYWEALAVSAKASQYRTL